MAQGKPRLRGPGAAGAWLVAALLLGALPAASAERTIADVVADTIRANPEVKRDRALLRAADRQVDVRFAGFLPRVDLESSGGYEYTNDPSTRSRVQKEPDDNSGRHLLRTDNSITVRQLVFDGFGTSSRELAAEAERRAAERRIAETSERIANRACEIYLDVLRTTEIARLALANRDYHMDIRDKVAARVNQGLSDALDLEQVNARLALANTGLARRQGELRVARARFAEFVGEEAKDLVRPGERVFAAPPTLDAALDEALKRNPAVFVTAYRVDAARADIEAARAAFYPRFDFEVQGNTGDNLDGVLGRESSITVLLKLRYNLFNGFFDDATVSRRSAQAAAAGFQDGETRRQLREDTSVFFRNLQTVQDRLVPQRDHVQSSKRTLDDYVAQFELGKRKLLDVLDAQIEHFEASVALTDSEYLLLLAQYRLAFALGQLRAVLGLPAD
ncbi:MAG: TolC family outer membrane protein [Alphaproteobacteria bacterium]|nr:TolC family outer membrane protein [Alphaproteobacteria bacterium]